MFVLPYIREAIQALSEGRLIRIAVAYVLRTVAVINLLAALYFFIELLKASFNLETKGTIAGLLFILVFLAANFVVIQILLYRADNVQQLGDSPFTVIPIFSLLFRTFGETYSVSVVSLGLGGCLFIWSSGMNPLALLPDLGVLFMTRGGQSFVDGLLMLVLSIVFAFLILIFFYFLAEIVVVMADIARNIRLLVPAGVAEASLGAAAPIATETSLPCCPSCGVLLASDERFCGNCGAAVGPLPSPSV
jgi:hypothetical protein